MWRRKCEKEKRKSERPWHSADQSDISRSSHRSPYGPQHARSTHVGLGDLMGITLEISYYCSVSLVCPANNTTHDFSVQSFALPLVL